MLLIGTWAGFLALNMVLSVCRAQIVEVEKLNIVRGEAKTVTETHLTYAPKETMMVYMVTAPVWAVKTEKLKKRTNILVFAKIPNQKLRQYLFGSHRFR